MLEFDALWAFALLPVPLLVWWLLPAYREREESVRVPFFEGLTSATGATPSRGGVSVSNSSSGRHRELDQPSTV